MNGLFIYMTDLMGLTSNLNHMVFKKKLNPMMFAQPTSMILVIGGIGNKVSINIQFSLIPL